MTIVEQHRWQGPVEFILSKVWRLFTSYHQHHFVEYKEVSEIFRPNTKPTNVIWPYLTCKNVRGLHFCSISILSHGITVISGKVSRNFCEMLSLLQQAALPLCHLTEYSIHRQNAPPHPPKPTTTKNTKRLMQVCLILIIFQSIWF